MNFNSNSEIAIIGGGMSGLSTLKELKEVGFNNIKLFEYSSDIGGNWDIHNNQTPGYKGMISNSSYKMWPFSDFMYNCNANNFSSLNDPNHPEYASIDQVHDHLTNYAKHFLLYDNIQLNSEVINITKNKQNHKWELVINHKQISPERDSKNIYSFDRIVLCNGTCSFPSYPKQVNIKELKENFNGEIYHSKEMKNVSSFKDKNIVVIGNSVSSCDIAEFSCINNAKSVYNLYREPRLLVNLWETGNTDRNTMDDTVDIYLFKRNKLHLFDPKQFAFYLDEYGFITPDLSKPEQVKCAFCKCGFKYFAEKGILKGVHGEISDVNGNNVYFKDMNGNINVLNDIDMIIFATGYEVNKPYKNILPQEINDRIYKPNIKKLRHLLYLLTFIAGYETDNIALIGANSFIGASSYEMQSRLIAQVWSENVKLPSVEIQNEWIKQYMIDYDPFWFIILLPCSPYLDDIAKFINVLPERKDYPKEYQYIYDKLQNDVFYGAQYRINGPGTNYDLKMKSLKLLSELIETECKESKQVQAKISGIPFKLDTEQQLL